MARMPPDFLLARAAEEVMARVRADGERVDYPGRALFEYLETHLFDTDLTVSSWCRACRIWKGTALYRVQATIGTTLGRYLEELRVETAMRMLVISNGEWAAGQVGFLVGYEGEEALRGAFERQTGLSHTAYRQQVRTLHRLGRRPPDPAWIRAGWLARLAAGELEPTEVLRVVAEIEAACGLVPSNAAGFGSRLDYERWLMARWWPRLRTLSAPELLDRLAQGFEFQRPALCELLWRQIGNMAPASASRGVELAKLAHAQVIRLGRHLADAEHSQLMARAWAWVGHAHRNAGDAAEAAPAFLFAEHWLERHPAPPAVTAEVRRLEGRLAGGIGPGDVVRLHPGARGGPAVGVYAGDVVRFPTAARGGPATGVSAGDVVHLRPGACNGPAVRVCAGDVVHLSARQGGDDVVEPGGEGLPQRAEARWRAGLGAGEDRGGRAGEQHEEAKAGEEAQRRSKHGGSSLRASSEPANRASLACSDPEVSPSLHPNRKPALVPGAVPEHLVDTELELTIYRVRRDAARAPEAWRPIFEQLAQRLFAPRLRVKALRKAHQLARPAETRAFEEVFGCEPGEYVTRLRIETVQALLPIESLTVWACAELVGFSSPSGFENAYQRLCHETPTETRARLAAAGKMVRPEPAAKSEEPLRRLLALQEPPATIAASCGALRERSRAALRERAGSVESWEQMWADEWWERVQEEPIAELWALLDGRLETAAAFETLCHASCEEGRADRQRGLEIAEAALESLVLLCGRLEASRLAELEAKGLAELGNAYRLAHDFPAAELSLAAAARCLENGIDVKPELYADVLRLRAALAHDNRRFEQALELTRRALGLVAGRVPRLEAQLLLRQGNICLLLERLDQAINEFHTAFELLSPEKEPYLAWVALQNLALASHKIGDNATARSWLERAEPIVRSLGQPLVICLRDWLMGLLAANQADLAQAELYLRRAHAGYERVKDVPRGALISLDLTTLYLHLDRPAEAAQLATEALPQLASLGLTTEGIEALGLLRQALEKQALSTAVLEKVRACIARMVNAPVLEPVPAR